MIVENEDNKSSAKEPIPVKIEQPKVMQVEVIGQQVPQSDDHRSMRPTTTEQEDIVTAGQREINRIWEHTQSKIALMSVISSQLINIVVIIALLFKKGETYPATIAVITASVAAMNLTVGIIIGFYFSRTNHSAIGGVGPKPVSSSIGTR